MQKSFIIAEENDYLMDHRRFGPLEPNSKYDPIKKWSHVLKYYSEHRSDWRRWMFRGHRNVEWHLRPSLERIIKDRFPSQKNQLDLWEENLLREFKRHAYRLSPHVPDKESVDEWLALLQHFGGPTRLLDWTYSFWVAAFFGVETVKPNKTFAIWAIDSDWLRDQYLESLSDDRKFKKRLVKNPKDPAIIKELLIDRQKLGEMGVVAINPFLFNTRHAVQQGVFLAAINLSRTFEENLEHTIGSVDPSDHIKVLRIQLNEEELRDAHADLHRMNINRATLFPGLEGYASHLQSLIAMPELFEGIRSSYYAGP